MGFSYRKLLMVCALSLGVHGFGQAAVAQDSSMAMENQMRAEADALPVLMWL